MASGHEPRVAGAQSQLRPWLGLHSYGRTVDLAAAHGSIGSLYELFPQWHSALSRVGS